jgi:hypothetical protein
MFSLLLNRFLLEVGLCGPWPVRKVPLHGSGGGREWKDEATDEALIGWASQPYSKPQSCVIR